MDGLSTLSSFFPLGVYLRPGGRAAVHAADTAVKLLLEASDDTRCLAVLMGEQIPAAPAAAPASPAAREEATAVHLDTRRGL